MKRNHIIILLALIFAVTIPAQKSFALVTWVSTSPLPPAYVGVPYSYQLQATSDATPPAIITYSVIGGPIPGLTLSSSGLISGTVTTTGSIKITIQAADGAVAAPVTRIFSISYFASGITGPLKIKRLQIHFDNNRPEITVTKNQQPPRAYAELSYIGSGLLRGYWSVDGTIHSHIQRTLTSGDNLVLPLPVLPPLPTYLTGVHRVQLVITEPNLVTVPEIVYFVTENEAKVFKPIEIVSPSDWLEVDYAPMTFEWYSQKNTSAYLIEFFEKEDGQPFFSAYTKKNSYTVPAHSLNRYFSEERTYLWKVKGMSEDDNINNESNIHRFTFTQ